MPEGSRDQWQWYMVRDDVWRAANMAPDGGVLCLDCIEKRLGRTLCRTDFTNAWINHLGQNNTVLRERMSQEFSVTFSTGTSSPRQSTTDVS